MTGQELFERLAPLVSPRIERDFKRRDLCIFATRIAMDVGAYFGIEVEPLPVRVVAVNWQFAIHMKHGEFNIRDYKADGSWSVGCGFGDVKQIDPAKWNAHMIAKADGWFGDFSIQQAERPNHGIITGPAIIGQLGGLTCWTVENAHGTRLEYTVHPAPMDYRRAPDWRDARRRRRIVGDLIRHLR